MSWAKLGVTPGRIAAATAFVGSASLTSRYLESQRRPLQPGTYGATTSEALSSLRRSGVGVVSDGIDQGLISAVKAAPSFMDLPTRTRQKPANGWRLSALGRFHRRDDALEASDVQVLDRVEQQFWPLVQAFFQEDGVSTDDIFRSEMQASTDRLHYPLRSRCHLPFFSCVPTTWLLAAALQVMTAVPGSTEQTWHRDNRARGLSIIVPLVDFTAENGATQMIVGSHEDAWPLVAEQGAQVVYAPAGALVAYDSRTIHRGLGNQTAEGRPALIFCYDQKTSPPPGCGVVGSVTTAYQARLLDIVSGIWMLCGSSLKGGD